MTAAPGEVVVDEVADVVDAPEIGTRVYRIRPGELTLGYNARTDIPDDPEFAASIREHGVLQPLVAYVDGPRLQVEMGQRRAFFAHQKGVAWVPVVLCVPPGPAGRLVDQLVENHHRTPISPADEAAAVAQLALLSLTVEEIARRTGRRRGDVDAALAVAASPVATSAAAALLVDLEQAAAIAEFDRDPAVVEQLSQAAGKGRGTFDHVLQQARDARRDAQERARVLDDIRAAGVTALDCIDWAVARPLQHLGLTPSKHRRCPGHAAYPRQDTHYVDGRHEWTWAPAYVCTEPHRHQPAAAAGEDSSLEEEAARQARAEVLEGNKRWRSAEQVRRRWLADFARRTRAPAPADVFIAQALLRGDDCLRRAADNQHVLLRELLAAEGADEPVAKEDLLDRVLPQQHRARVLAVVALLAAWDATSDVHCWRERLDGHLLGGHRGVDAFYMGWYREFGHELSEIERRVLGEVPLPMDGAT